MGDRAERRYAGSKRSPITHSRQTNNTDAASLASYIHQDFFRKKFSNNLIPSGVRIDSG